MPEQKYRNSFREGNSILPVISEDSVHEHLALCAQATTGVAACRGATVHLKLERKQREQRTRDQVQLQKRANSHLPHLSRPYLLWFSSSP